MRYVNLHKRNTSKFHFISKRLASVSLLCLTITAVVVVPLTTKANDFQAKEETPIIEIDNEYLGNDTIEVLKPNAEVE